MAKTTLKTPEGAVVWRSADPDKTVFVTKERDGRFYIWVRDPAMVPYGYSTGYAWRFSNDNKRDAIHRAERELEGAHQRASAHATIRGMRSGTRSRAAQLDRDIASALSKKPHHATTRGCPKCGPHHAVIRECATWDPGAPVEHLTEAKRQAASEYESCYLVNLMQRAGSVSEAARLAGLDRSNFKKLLHRHGMQDPKE